MDIVITFKSTHEAMKAKKHVIVQPLEGEIIPTPREISKECGFAILVKNSSADKVMKFFEDNRLIYSHIYEVINEGGKKRYEENN